MMTPASTLFDLLRAQGGYVTTAEVTAAGIPRVELTRKVQNGSLERLTRGVYRLACQDALVPADAAATDLLEVQLRYPYARPCLISALHLHGLTTTRPSRLQFAVPRNRQTLKVAELPTETFYFSGPSYSAGLVQIEVRGRPLTTYSVEKALVDLLRYAPKFGREIYLEGLKNALRAKRLDRRTLTRLAKDLGAWKELSRDLEVLSHDQDH